MKLLVFLSVVAAVAVNGEDKCAPKPGDKHVHAGECCKVDSSSLEGYMKNAKSCMDKYPKLSKPPGPPPSGEKPTPSPAMKNERACLAECVFNENKLLTSDKKLDKDAIMKLLTMGKDGEMKKVITAAINKCFDQIEVDSSLECKSGATEFQKCAVREFFLNCPPSAWTSSSDCDGLKTKISSCPMMPIKLGQMRGPPPQ